MIMPPLAFGREIGAMNPVDGRPQELTREGAEALMKQAPEAQRALAAFSLESRLKVVDDARREWERRLNEGKLEELQSLLIKRTGYARGLIDLEFNLISQVLDSDILRANLQVSLIGGAKSIEDFVDMGQGEGILNAPAGPNLIIASGNSVVPTLIPTMVSLLTGNATILKPAAANYPGVVEALSCLSASTGEAADALRACLTVVYMNHEGEALEYLLGQAPVGVVNFWGGEPGRTSVRMKVAGNPHMPRFFANGPMTGVAIIDEASAQEATADGLAVDVVVYDQQLCSSPTLMVFVGGWEVGLVFGKMLGRYLDDIGSEFPLNLSDDQIFILQGARRSLMVRGSTLLNAKDQANPWTIALDRGKIGVDLMMKDYPSMALHVRRRFLQIVVVKTVAEAAALICELPSHVAYHGIDRVQTVGIALDEKNHAEALHLLARAGVYRFIPIGDMFMRGPAEPYDGVSMASLFTYACYARGRPTLLGERD
ncbi:MAG: aldehyde dehydrogenase family protein [Methanomassiliicoccales archaeon]